MEAKQSAEVDNAPARPVGLRERKKARTRRRIAETALRLVAERGYGRVTVDDIAEGAEISQPTFYKYYPSKDAILMEYAMHGFGDMLHRMADTPGPVVERLRSYFSEIAAQVTTDRHLWQAIALSNAYNPIRNPGLLKSAEAGTRVMEAVLREGQERGELTREVSAEQMASVLEGTMLRAAIEWAGGLTGGPDLRTRMGAMFDFFLRAARS